MRQRIRKSNNERGDLTAVLRMEAIPLSTTAHLEVGWRKINRERRKQKNEAMSSDGVSQPENRAGTGGNRTHLPPLSRRDNGFEVREGHQVLCHPRMKQRNVTTKTRTNEQLLLCDSNEISLPVVRLLQWFHFPDYRRFSIAGGMERGEHTLHIVRTDSREETS
jgi:hypothetical protein